MKKILTMLLVATLPFIGLAAWIEDLNKSNGTTPVVIVEAPLADTSRTVPANGGIYIVNTASSNVTFHLIQTGLTETNSLTGIKGITLTTNNAIFWNPWVKILSTTNSSIQLHLSDGSAEDLDITTHFRDEGQ